MDSNIFQYLKGVASRYSEKDLHFYVRGNKLFGLIQCKQGIEMTPSLYFSCLYSLNLMKIIRKLLSQGCFFSIQLFVDFNFNNS